MLRIIHTLGGCGGTLISRCLGVFPEVALLSEVNPASIKLNPAYHPLYQDSKWFHLLTKDDMELFSRLDLQDPGNFRDLMQVFHDRACVHDRCLVIRDYNYVEFVGIPYTSDPPLRLLLYQALPQSIASAAIALIRHPVDQWFSLSKHLQPGSGLTPPFFCDAYAAFLRELGSTPVFKYEDFLANPEDDLRAMCTTLDLPFAPSFRDRFHQFDSVTGDLTRLGDPSISAPAPKHVPLQVIDAFRSSESYQSILEKTGYLDFASPLKEQV